MKPLKIILKNNKKINFKFDDGIESEIIPSEDVKLLKTCNR